MLSRNKYIGNVFLIYYVFEKNTILFNVAITYRSLLTKSCS